jgi:hypothetical protein
VAFRGPGHAGIVRLPGGGIVEVDLDEARATGAIDLGLVDAGLVRFAP